MTDLLVPAFQNVMDMSQTQSSMIQMAFYGAYFCMALPAALYIQRFSYKNGVITGLLIYACGSALCYPAMLSMDFDYFLLAFYVFACGCAFLETTVAPYVLSMGPLETATRRINLAQSFNPMGSIVGLFLGKFIILAQQSSASERAVLTVSEKQRVLQQDLGHVVDAYLLVGVAALILAIVIFLSISSINAVFHKMKSTFPFYSYTFSLCHPNEQQKINISSPINRLFSIS